MHLPCKFLVNWGQPALPHENQHFCKVFSGQWLAEILVTELDSLVNISVTLTLLMLVSMVKAARLK